MKPRGAPVDRLATVLPARLVRGASVGLAMAWIWSQPGAWGHDLFTAFVQHRVQLVVGAQHADVTLELTFFEDASEHEREHLDTNGNRRISQAERESYLRRLAPAAEKLVRLKAGGRELPLTPLYSPRLDLLGSDEVGRGHHRLTLFFFAPTPRYLKPGDEFLIEDRLWPEARALGSLEVEGRDGCRLEVLPRGDPVFPPARDGEARVLKARCLRPPEPKKPT